MWPPLGATQIRAIAKFQTQRVVQRMAERNIKLEFSDVALDQLAKAGYDPVYGARPLKRAIQSEIENPLAKAILEGRFAPKDRIYVDHRGGRMTFEKSAARKAAA